MLQTKLVDGTPANTRRIILVGFLLMAFIGYLDYITGVEIVVSIFYLIPIGLVSWGARLTDGLLFSVIGGVLWWSMEMVGGHIYSSTWIGFWNAGMRMLIFLITSILLSKLKETLSAAVEARQTAEEATKAKSLFLANMSHEIRTPMNAIIAMAELLSESPLNDEQKSYVQIFKKEGHRLMQLINDLLDLSKIESGGGGTELVAFTLRKLIGEVTSLAAVPIREKGIHFECTISPEVPDQIMGDPAHLKRVLHNLLSNAAKFTNQGSIKLSIEQSGHESAEILRFALTDTGIGIASEKLELIFEAFKQEDESTSLRYGGTGLGLSLCRKMVENMGGRIFAESVKGIGSRFQFEIPLLRDSTSHLHSPFIEAPEQSETPPSPDTRPLRILLAEDYDVNRQIVRAFIKDTAYFLEDAEDGAAAIAKFKSAEYDLVLLDISMPIMDGYQVCKAMREWENVAAIWHTPIVALTAHAYEEDIKRSLSAGCDAHLSKPVDKTSLLHTIQKLTKDRQGLGKNAVVESQPDNPTPPPNNRVLEELRPQFIENARSTCSILSEEIKNQTSDQARIAGHNLKGAGTLFGLPEISALGAQIEKAAISQNFDSLENLRTQLEAALMRIDMSSNRPR